MNFTVVNKSSNRLLPMKVKVIESSFHPLNILIFFSYLYFCATHCFLFYTFCVLSYLQIFHKYIKIRSLFVLIICKFVSTNQTRFTFIKRTRLHLLFTKLKWFLISSLRVHTFIIIHFPLSILLPRLFWLIQTNESDIATFYRDAIICIYISCCTKYSSLTGVYAQVNTPSRRRTMVLKKERGENEKIHTKKWPKLLWLKSKQRLHSRRIRFTSTHKKETRTSTYIMDNALSLSFSLSNNACF